MKKRVNKWALVLTMAMAVMLALPTTTFAQRSNHGGLFGTDPSQKSSAGSGMLSSKGTRGTGTEVGDGGFTNGDFGEEPNAPLGSGIAVLMGLGLGYVALKKKEDEQ